MFGDTAIAVHPSDERYKHLVGKKVILPLVGREIPVIADEYVEKARIWAEQMIADAQHKADGIVDAAKKTAAAISPLRPDGSFGGALSEEQLDAIADISDQLDELSRNQATQIMQLRRKLMTMATDM